MKNLFLFVFLGLAVMTTEVLGQKSDKNLARFTFIVAKEGMQKQFEDGYKRHLEWHIDNGDQWNWYGWFIASGNRLGYFVDATFGHDWAEFDKPVDSAKDVADIAINVLPFARFYTQFTCVYLPEFSNGTEANLSSSLPQNIYFKIKPGFELTFEKFLAELNKDWQKSEPKQNYLWYRIEDGGESPQYLLFLPHKNFTEKQKSENFLAKLWSRNPTAQTLFQTSVDSIRNETLRYRSDMTFIPK